MKKDLKFKICFENFLKILKKILRKFFFRIPNVKVLNWIWVAFRCFFTLSYTCYLSSCALRSQTRDLLLFVYYIMYSKKNSCLARLRSIFLGKNPLVTWRLTFGIWFELKSFSLVRAEVSCCCLAWFRLVRWVLGGQVKIKFSLVS